MTPAPSRLAQTTNWAPLHDSDNSPIYLLPVSHDTATGASRADSFAIAGSLEKTYSAAQPRRRSCSHSTAALQSLIHGPQRRVQRLRFALLDMYLVLNPMGMDYFWRTREAAFGMSLEDIAPMGDDAVAE